MGQSVPIPRTFGIAPEWRRQANSKSDEIQPLISLNPLPPAAVTQLCLRQYSTHYFTKRRTDAMFKTYPTFAAGTWLCAWTRTAAWVSLSGASARSTLATTPFSSHHRRLRQIPLYGSPPSRNTKSGTPSALTVSHPFCRHLLITWEFKA